MKLKGSSLFIILIWCLFMGVTAISIGFGAAFPPLNLIAKPFVCPTGKMDLSEQTYSPYPGNTITTITWYCTDETSKAKTELGIFPMSLYAGVIYGLLLFVVIFLFMFIRSKRTGQLVSSGGGRVEQTSGSASFTDQARQFRDQAAQFHETTAEFNQHDLSLASNVLARMKELKELRNANLITEDEYKAKRKDILGDL